MSGDLLEDLVDTPLYGYFGWNFTYPANLQISIGMFRILQLVDIKH
ncbi:hypothetical protein LEP1GSC195_2250 [Leptospira wolbachii serovar Codice str. CDC]|uniref:Uncharacterized protein n=1 Tax=Leptospira wolbachii serovar Codice str. CDC TaxID=1218599 RepID=R8ZZU5_9LEPT|nr:hypothetical protein LEP1GSC195_2250 [Leptospira wolbachii serovar Codice str. CDC]